MRAEIDGRQFILTKCALGKVVITQARTEECHLPHSTETIPRVPTALALALRLLPLAPISLSMTAYSRTVARSHPGLFRRLGDYSHTKYVLDPTDLPFVICIDPNGGLPRVSLSRGRGEGTARITGSLAALLGLVHGQFDGDALFFSRDLVVEGDTSAVLALRNAVDDAELDLSQEISSLCGPMGDVLQRAFVFMECRSGFCLTRSAEVEAW
tara:strand:+ start:2537 stop:3172 length:636 start_codon:yes stop_codon:yes gene_type:complete